MKKSGGDRKKGIICVSDKAEDSADGGSQQTYLESYKVTHANDDLKILNMTFNSFLTLYTSD